MEDDEKPFFRNLPYGSSSDVAEDRFVRVSANCTLKPLDELFAVLVLGGTFEGEEPVGFELVSEVFDGGARKIFLGVLVVEVFVVKTTMRSRWNRSGGLHFRGLVKALGDSREA